MDWQVLQRWLQQSLTDVTGELAYRTALRAIPSVASGLEKSWASRKRHSPLLLAAVRALILARATIDSPELNLSSAQQRSARAIDKFAGTYDHAARSIRAMCQVFLETAREQRFERTRQAIQAAKDGTKNLVPSTFYPVDIWQEVKGDVSQINRESRTSPDLPPNVLSPDYAQSAAWRSFVDHLEFYSQNWEPWIQWLEYRLFGINAFDLPPSQWRQFEHAIATLPDSIWDEDIAELNSFVGSILEGYVREFESPTEIEKQNPSALTFRLGENGKISLEDRPDSSYEEPQITNPLYEEMVESSKILLEACIDNSSSRVKSRLEGYLTALGSLDTPSFQVLMVARGDSLRKELEFQGRLDDDSDIAPLKDSVYSLLEQLVRKHNLFVNLTPSLSEMDKMLLGPDRQHSLVSPDEIKGIVSTPAAKEAIDSAAIEALTEIAEAAPEEPDSTNRDARRASESAKNLVRKSVEVLYRHWKKIGVAVATTSSSLYAIGKWALANEATISRWFANSTIMQETIRAIMKWLHTLPLV